MRFVAAAIVTGFVSLASFGCLGVEVEPIEDPSDKEETGEVEQELDESGGEGSGETGGVPTGCTDDCRCPLGTHCYVDGTCRGTVVFSPAPPRPPCVDSCQCPSGQWCDIWGSYGYCKSY